MFLWNARAHTGFTPLFVQWISFDGVDINVCMFFKYLYAITPNTDNYHYLYKYGIWIYGGGRKKK